jgi:type 1 glutamine amidotransferase
MPPPGRAEGGPIERKVQMKRRAVLMAAAAGCFALTLQAGSSPRCETASEPKRVLVVSHTAGFRHSAIPLGEKILLKLAQEDRGFSVTFCRTAEDVKRLMSPGALRRFDAVVFNNTTGNLGIPDLQAFLNWIRQGNGFVGIHAATDTYHPEQTGGDRGYIDMVGGQFKTHGAQAAVDIIVEDRDHPSTRHLGPVWTVKDEIYEFRENNRDRLHVLMALDRHPDDGHPEAGQPGDYLIAWCRNYGRGRVFYTALGHRDDVWESPEFQKHLLGGIRWALGLEGGPARK